AGLDNAKLKVFDDFKANVKKVRAAVRENTPPEKMPRVLSDDFDGTREIELREGDETVKVPVMFVTQKTYDALKAQAKKEQKEPPKLLQTTLQGDLATLRAQKEAGRSVEAKLEETLTRLNDWWNREGLPNFSADEYKLDEARLFGAKQALLYTAVVP